MFPQYKGENWQTDLAFPANVLEHPNLNVILRGKEFLVHNLHTMTEAFKTQLFLFSKQVKEIYTFPYSTKVHVTSSTVDKYSNILSNFVGDLTISRKWKMKFNC
jgi:hypothetical protein